MTSGIISTVVVSFDMYMYTDMCIYKTHVHFRTFTFFIYIYMYIFVYMCVCVCVFVFVVWCRVTSCVARRCSWCFFCLSFVTCRLLSVVFSCVVLLFCVVGLWWSWWSWLWLWGGGGEETGRDKSNHLVADSRQSFPQDC